MPLVCNGVDLAVTFVASSSVLLSQLVFSIYDVFGPAINIDMDCPLWINLANQNHAVWFKQGR